VTASGPHVPDHAPRGGSLAHAWRALRHRNFKLFFAGQSISLIGTWMTRLATSWLVYRLTHSALLLGVVGFAGQIASLALGPFAGVWVERLDRRKLLVWTQGAAAVQSLAMAALTLACHHNPRDHRTRRLPGIDQRLRHAGAAVLPRANGRGPQ